MRSIYPTRSELLRVSNWLVGDDTGASSIYLAASLFNLVRPQCDYPHDPDDFGRCLRMLKRCSPSRGIDSMRVGHGPVWRAFAIDWERMENWYAKGRNDLLYEHMKHLRELAESQVKL